MKLFNNVIFVALANGAASAFNLAIFLNNGSYVSLACSMFGAVMFGALVGVMAVTRRIS